MLASPAPARSACRSSGRPNLALGLATVPSRLPRPTPLGPADHASAALVDEAAGWRLLGVGRPHCEAEAQWRRVQAFGADLKPRLQRGSRQSRPGSVGYLAASEKLAGASGSRTFDHALHALDTAGHRPTSRTSFRGLTPAQAGPTGLGLVSPTGGYRRAVDGRKAFTASAPSRLLHRAPSACRSEVATASQPIIKFPHRMLQSV